MQYEHKKYPSIEQAYREDEINYWKENCTGLKEYDGPWVIHEKIHGANFGIGTVDGTTIKFQSRNIMVPEITPCQKQAFQHIIDCIPKIWKQLDCKEQLTIFGEYFGGSWKNYPSVGERVQRGVYYTPRNEFAVFDIYKDGNYLPHCTVHALCTELGIFMPHLLAFCETLDEALAYPNDRESEIWRDLQKTVGGKFTLEENQQLKEPNIMEGIVIRPALADIWCGDHRIIFKSKNDKFKEVASKAKSEEMKELPEEIAKYYAMVEPYVTEARLQNVLSHYGVKKYIEDFSEVIKDFAADVLDDFNKDHADLVLDKSTQKYINKHISKLASPLIKEALLY